MDLVEVSKRGKEILNRHPWETARLEIVNELLDGIIRDDENFNVLDIGCGDVFFVNELSKKYPKTNFYAIDIAFTDETIKQLNEKIVGRKIQLFKSMEEAQPFIKGKADLALLLDVVEHIEDDLGFLSGLRKQPVVTVNTSIMITVPAYQRLFCSHDTFLGHYRRYTNKTLLNVIQNAGFEKVRVGYFFFSLVPPRILQVLKEKISKPDSATTGLVEWNQGAFVTALITGFLKFDFRVTSIVRSVFGIKFPGLSNYLICKKSA